MSDKKKPKAEPKSTVPKTKSRKVAPSQSKSSQESLIKPKRTWRRWIVYTALKLSLLTACFLLIYVIYLDAKVQRKFEGQRWQVPVQVYSNAEAFSIGDKLLLPVLTKALLQAGYQKVTSPRRPGQISSTKNRLIVFREAFDMGEIQLSNALIQIDVTSGHIAKLYIDNVAVNKVQLSPQLLARLVPESKEDRVLVNLENVPEALLDTLLLVEDRDFYFHKGVSPLGILRALYTNLTAGRTVQGGSTLTQQLVKNMYLSREKTLTRKVNEALMALILEYRYSKDQLLEAYINEVYLGQHYANGIYGFGLASEFYFGRSITQLAPAQMALMVGVIKGPSFYDPWRRPERAKKRRDLILRLMFEQHLINRQQFEYAINSQLQVREGRRMAKQKSRAFMHIVKQELAQILDGVEQNSGIKVLTGFSFFQQMLLEQSATKTLENIEREHQQKALQVASVITDITSGEVRAVIGDRNIGVDGFNRALSAQRPIGSLIKPMIYLPALERYEQYNFASLVEDKPIALGSEQGSKWQPKNYDGKFRGEVPLIDGLVKSLNIPTVNLGMSLGLDNVQRSLTMLGYQEDQTLRPSMLLGAINMSPYQINQLYMTIANKGIYQQAHAVKSVIAHNGETMWRFQSTDEQRLSDQSSYLLNYALIQVAETGTARSLTWRLPDAIVAGKTGTSNDQRDSWFVGYDNQHLVTTWLGRDDNKATKLTGSSGALVLFADVMKQIGVNNISQKRPDNISLIRFESATGNAVKENCKQTIEYPVVTTNLNYSNCMEKLENKRTWLEKLFGN